MLYIFPFLSLIYNISDHSYTQTETDESLNSPKNVLLNLVHDSKPALVLYENQVAVTSRMDRLADKAHPRRPESRW